MSFPAYPAYKDSGVKWLSDVPEHWDIRRNKQVFSLVSTQVGDKSADFQLLSLTLRGVIPRDMESGKGKFPAEFDTYQVVEPGDIVFCLFDIDETPRTVGISSDYGMITGAYTVAKTLAVADPRFIYYYYFSIDLRKGLRPFYTGLRKVVRPETFLNIELPLPPLSEQANICNFLDHETACIDALIEEQQRLIELLKEKRQAVISHAVTKGLDPTVPMKDSGVEWLGEVPAHWIYTKLGRLAFMQEGPGLRNWQFTDQGTRVICVTNITESGINFDRLEKFISEEEYRSSYRHFTVRQGDLMLSSSGNSWGKVAEYTSVEPVILNTSTIRLNELIPLRLTRKFLRWFLESKTCREQLDVAMTGACQPNFGPTHLNEVITACPPAQEQIAIASYLDVKISEFRELIRVALETVDILQERRSALISAAVTGKIDVRGWQPAVSTQAQKLEVAEAD